MTIYLDTCALNRLGDDLIQPRVFAEADAVLEILEAISAGTLRWIASGYLRVELVGNPDSLRRAESLKLLRLVSEWVTADQSIEERARTLEAQGFGAFDALHLATCEREGVDYLITVDDRFLRRAGRVASSRALRVMNPVDFIAARQRWKLKP